MTGHETVPSKPPRSGGSQIKLAIYIFLPLALITSCALWFFYSQEINFLKTNLKKNESSIVNIESAKINGDFDLIISDLLFFASYNQLLNMLDGKEHALDQTASDIALFVKGSKLFDQIRILDITGMEMIRVNWQDNTPVIIPQEKLQFKGRRYYFLNSVMLEKEQIYVSPFDLNMEKDKIEIPIKPTIRFGTPIFTRDGAASGVIIFNYMGKNLINSFKNLVAGSSSFQMLCNPDGYWLVGPETDLEWGFMYEDRQDQTMRQHYPEAWEKIADSESGQFADENGLFTFNTVYPLLANQQKVLSHNEILADGQYLKKIKRYYWKVISLVPRDRIQEIENRAAGKYLNIALAITMVMGILSGFLAKAIHKRKTAEAKLIETNRELKQADEMKNKFLGVAAHDLRNPLISIRGFSEMILDESVGPVNDEQKEFIDIINTTSQDMLSLVNDLLDVAVIESGYLKMTPEKQPLETVLKERVHLAENIAARKKMTLDCTIHEGPDFSFDKGRIAQVIDNLVGNAIKFSPFESKIVVRLEWESDFALISIQDEGPGISPEEQSRLFGKFQKLSVRPTGDEKSTGLGLAIVKKIVDAHSGSVSVDSQLGVGTTFQVKLPLHTQDAADATPP